MITVATIVEGDGEVAALPVLLRRLGVWLSPALTFDIPPPIRVRRDQFLQRQDVFERQVRLAGLRCAQPGWIMIVLDADDDCPRTLAEEIGRRARRVEPAIGVSVVVPNREYEAWFIAAADSLDGRRGFVRPPGALPDAESVRGAKQWMSRNVPGGKYHEVRDQAAFSALMDLRQVRDGSRSFRKLCSDWTSRTAALAP